MCDRYSTKYTKGGSVLTVTNQPEWLVAIVFKFQVSKSLSFNLRASPNQIVPRSAIRTFIVSAISKSYIFVTSPSLMTGKYCTFIYCKRTVENKIGSLRYISLSFEWQCLQCPSFLCFRSSSDCCPGLPLLRFFERFQEGYYRSLSVSLDVFTHIKKEKRP